MKNSIVVGICGLYTIISGKKWVTPQKTKTPLIKNKTI